MKALILAGKQTKLWRCITLSSSNDIGAQNDGCSPRAQKALISMVFLPLQTYLQGHPAAWSFGAHSICVAFKMNWLIRSIWLCPCSMTHRNCRFRALSWSWCQQLITAYAILAESAVDENDKVRHLFSQDSRIGAAMHMSQHDDSAWFEPHDYIDAVFVGPSSLVSLPL